jgi:hypothetical protein
MERGAADALVRLVGSRRLRPTLTFAEAAKIAGISEHAAREAINRLQRTHRPKPMRRRNAPGPAPAGTKWCGYGEHFPRLEVFQALGGRHAEASTLVHLGASYHTVRDPEAARAV